MSLKINSTRSHARTARIAVFVLAALLVANLAVGHAWAREDSDKGKHHDEKQDRGDHDKSRDNQDRDRGRGRSDDRPRDDSPQQDPPAQPPAKLERTVDDLINLSETGQSELKTSVQVSGSEIQPATSGATGVQAAPTITVTSPWMLHVSGNQGVEITFDSTVAGRYAVSIRSDSGDVSSQTLAGRLQAGANSVLWEGRDASGALVPDGQYMYYITAESAGGIREPPAAGDGAILVTAAFPVATLDANLLLLAIPVALAAGAAALLFIRRRRSLTIFVPVEAVVVVDEIKERYPDAAVANYIEPKADGAKWYIGVTIQKGADNEWLEEIAARAKEMAAVDSVSLNYRGKMQVL